MTEIYKITNCINDKVYIGQTRIGINKRFEMHKKDSHREIVKNRSLYKAMNEFGLDNFTISIVDTCEDKDADFYEQLYISQYDSYRNGYNDTVGGSGKQFYNYENIIDILNKSKNCKEAAIKIGCCVDTVRAVAKLYDIDVHYDNEYKLSLKNSCKSVLQYDKDGNLLNEFSSAVCAGDYISKLKHINLTSGIRGHICEVCNGKRKTAYGFMWKYK